MYVIKRGTNPENERKKKMEKQIDEKVMKYIPVKLRDRVVSCDRYDRSPLATAIMLFSTTTKLLFSLIALLA